MTKRHRSTLVREAVATLVAHGFVPIVNDVGKHRKLCWIDRKGRRCVLVISRSPSDHRTRVNSLALLRRLLRTDQERKAP